MTGPLGELYCSLPASSMPNINTIKIQKDCLFLNFVIYATGQKTHWTFCRKLFKESNLKEKSSGQKRPKNPIEKQVSVSEQ